MPAVVGKVGGGAFIRIYPQMTQTFTDEEKHLCSSVNICGTDF